MSNEHMIQFGCLIEEIEEQFLAESGGMEPGEKRDKYIEDRWESMSVRDFVNMLDYMGYEIPKIQKKG